MVAIKIWHDNSGDSGDSSSWYLKRILVHNLQTREKSYFLCEKWLAIDKDDGLLERFLPICYDKEKTSFKYLYSKQTKEKLSDDHLWFSIFARPIQSSFSRLDRLTCCLVLLSLSMVMNILYYGMDNSPSQAGLQIGPFINLTLQQVSVGVITNLIVFIPSLLLIQLFRRTRRRNTRLSSIKKVLNEHDLGVLEETQDKKKRSKLCELKFPWWFKIIAYAFSFTITVVCLFFVVLKGIEFGNDKVTKWLTSVLISFFSSIFLTQPLQVDLFVINIKFCKSILVIEFSEIYFDWFKIF